MAKRFLHTAFFSICILVSGLSVVQAQKINVDSLRRIIATTTNSQQKVTAMCAYATEIWGVKNDSALLLARQALGISQKNGFIHGIGIASNALGMCWNIKNKDSSLHYFRRAVFYCVQANESRLWMVRSHNNLIHAYLEFARYDSALQAGRKAVSIINTWPGGGDEKDEQVMNLYAAIGRTHYYVSNYDSSAAYYLKAITIGERQRNYYMLASYYQAMGMINSANKEFDKAIDWGKKSVMACKQNEDSAFLILSYSSIGSFYEKLNNYEQAGKYVDSSINLAYAFDSTRLRSISYMVLGNIETHNKNYSKALEYYQKGLAIENRRSGNASSRSSFQRKFAGLYLLLDNLPQAEKEYTQLVQSAGADNELKADAYMGLSEVYKKQANYMQAYNSLSEAKKLYDEIFNKQKNKTLQDLNIKYETESKERKLLLLENEKLQQQREKTLQQAIYSRQKGRLILAIFATLAIAIILALYYNRRQLKHRASSQQALMQERLRISRELHDEVGATLSGVVMYSHFTRDQVRASNISGVENSLNIMQQSSEEMVKKLNEIVWLVNPEKDTLQKLVQRLEEYAHKIAAARGMKVQFQVPASLPERSIDFERRRNIYFICKEAINNAIKYSGGSQLTFNIRIIAEMLVIVITDNGAGFNALQEYTGNGLVNMQKRAEEINGRFLIKSSEKAGTSISLECAIK